MKVLFITSELDGFKKFGGLGDFSASLPKYLTSLGVDVDIMVPFYSDIDLSSFKTYKSLELLISFANATYKASFIKTKLLNSDVDVILVAFDKGFLKQFSGETSFYAFFNKCVVEYVTAQFNTYDLLHCNDWHTGLIPHLLVDTLGQSRPKTLLTIHNLSYIGMSDTALIKNVGLNPGTHNVLDYESADGSFTFMYQGLSSFDILNTVSPSYAIELLSDKSANPMTSVLKARSDRFIGILNGIDYDILPRSYDKYSYRAAKDATKEFIQRRLNLNISSVPLFSFISRLDSNQKGLDLLFEGIHTINEKGGQCVILSVGDPLWEGKLRDECAKLSNVVFINEFNTDLALALYAASDFFLLPSKFEPCGLTQMMSMWYGTLPIVHATGGLKDTVIHNHNGIVFTKHSKKDFDHAIKEALSLYADDRKVHEMILQAMSEDFSWSKSALEYKDLYFRALSL